MGSPVTFSGFNGIDFNTILNSVMQQARGPLTALENRQSGFKSQLTSLGKLTAQATSLRDAARDLFKSDTSDTVAATTTDAAAVSVSAKNGAVAGRYDIVVQQLARAQVTASTSTWADANSTVVATGGSLTIGDTTVNITGSVTLQQLAKAINTTTGIGVTASIVRSGDAAYKLVLTGKNTGADQAFAVTNDLTGSSATFGSNAVEASNASILVNNVEAVSSTNEFDTAVPGVTLKALKADPDETIGVEVESDSAAIKTRLDTFVKAYNSLVGFFGEQRTSQVNGDAGSLARDPLVRQMAAQLRQTLAGQYGGGAIDRLSQIGLEFTMTGTLKLDATKFADAVDSNSDAVFSLVSGSGSAFAAIDTAINAYTDAGGLLKAGRDRVQQQIRALDTQLADAQTRLNTYRQTMQQEFLAAEMAMSRLRAQSGSLSGIGQ